MRLTPSDVRNVAFRRPPLGKRGYDEDEVDAFLRAVEATLDHSATDTVTVADVEQVRFRKPPLGKRGYDEDEVDAFLDLVTEELRQRAAEPHRPALSPFPDRGAGGGVGGPAAIAAAGGAGGGDGAAVVRAIWGRAQARDWDGVAQLLSPDFTVEWPGTRERFTGRDAWLAVNRNTPEGWHLVVDTIIGAGDEVASRVFVRSAQGAWHTISFWRLRGGVATYLSEYYVQEWGAQPR